MREFSIPPQQLLAMPIRLFWSMSRAVDRLRAEVELRELNIALCAAVTAQGEKQFLGQLRENLADQMGAVVRMRAVREERPIATPADIMRLQQL